MQISGKEGHLGSDSVQEIVIEKSAGVCESLFLISKLSQCCKMRLEVSALQDLALLDENDTCCCFFIDRVARTFVQAADDTFQIISLQYYGDSVIQSSAPVLFHFANIYVLQYIKGALQLTERLSYVLLIGRDERKLLKFKHPPGKISSLVHEQLLVGKCARNFKTTTAKN